LGDDPKFGIALDNFFEMTLKNIDVAVDFPMTLKKYWCGCGFSNDPKKILTWIIYFVMTLKKYWHGCGFSNDPKKYWHGCKFSIDPKKY
jgi:hypothetical protein